jgi:hypothetical protein
VTVTDTFKSFSFEGSSARRDIEQAAKHCNSNFPKDLLATVDLFDPTNQYFADHALRRLEVYRGEYAFRLRVNLVR